ncbi:hypothetical protein MKZ38_010239 [Zalerion maritima]|uniref:Regulatory P domain-containing protein n=1 Tax=Zalerion maritima TaxID=339359 RepID=A0AAD5RSM6_9PEZI|nr:hypothetical protein MKZ38_010239 [Zalerion maritima]
MKVASASATAAALLAGSVSAGTGQLMGVMMDKKEKFREVQRANGRIDTATSTQVTTTCTNGKAGEYECENVDMWGFISHASMGSSTREGNDLWGWTSSMGREFAIVGQTDGTAFVEVLSDGSLDYVARLPSQTVSSIWRDAKVIGDYVYIGSEASGHGMQIFDLNKLLDVKPDVDSTFSPKTFSTSSDLTAWYSSFGSSHNIVANAETDMIYVVGTASSAGCSGGLWMIDVSDPASPEYKGCVSSDGYVHDAQCVVYNGVDSSFNGHEICFNYNEDSLTIVDVTDKGSPVQLSKTSYNGASYTHQGWVADSEFKVLLLDDELDEMDANGPAANQHTTTYVVDISDLTSPSFTGVYQSPVKSIDHNQYVVNGLSYQSNYGSGLRIVDVSSLNSSTMEQVGFFDCYPEDDDNPAAEFYGSWSVYPYFDSGVIILNSIERGLFALKYTG